MSTHLISFRATNYFSDFICDYLDKKPELKPLYHRFPTIENFKHQIEEKSLAFQNKNRVLITNVLEQHYKNVEVSEWTKKNIEALKLKNTFTITTGHQLNLFTGPLYFIYKIISTINLTKQLKESYPDYNFVPVYWMATEDHDFKEINSFNFREKIIQWNSKQTGAVGHFSTEGIDDVFKVISSEFGKGKHAETLKKWFKDAYLNHNNLADAVRYLTNKLFGAYGLVVLDANHKDLKRLFIPYIEKELTQKVTFKHVSKTNTALKDLGVKIPVNPREINLFYIDNNLRERIIFENPNFKVINTNISWTKAELLKHLNEFPERFSPNVIMRPLYQDVILPNLCYIGGGAELGYWLQLKSSFKTQGVTFPILLLRNSVLITSKKQANKLETLHVNYQDLFLNKNAFVNKKVSALSNIDIDFSEQVMHLQQQFKNLYKLTEQTDRSFIGAVKAQEAKQIKGLKHLEKRLLKAQKKKLAKQIERSTAIQDHLFPNENLQERVLNFSELYLDYGDAFIPQLITALDPLKSAFLILTL